MTEYFAAGFAAVAVLWLIVWSAKGLLLTPVRLGKHTEAEIRLRLRGSEPMLEYMLRSLIWLRENGTLRAEIRIIATEPDELTATVGRRFERQYRGISYTEENQSDAAIKRD